MNLVGRRPVRLIRCIINVFMYYSIIYRSRDYKYNEIFITVYIIIILLFLRALFKYYRCYYNVHKYIALLCYIEYLINIYI